MISTHYDIKQEKSSKSIIFNDGPITSLGFTLRKTKFLDLGYHRNKILLITEWKLQYIKSDSPNKE